ncbi:hypothetical protein EGM88_03850 [Aureibaculum marinum]|uniref:Lipoprotein n=1 Tax=Aureibaculum marinum TaxID=2487930 RepID=A0A3N4NZP6_9FLAO|nr:hypothetical protein [Aureibaculum marinum]RPD99688.1 hypothetical protein EGM88_03850 [Aureibaculum marinum]
MKLYFLIVGVLTFLIVGCNSNSNTKENMAAAEKNYISKEIIEVDTVTPKENIYLITNKAVGEFKIGDRIPDVGGYDYYMINKKTMSKMNEDGLTKSEDITYIVNGKGSVLVHLKPKYDDEKGEYTKNIGEIIVISEKYKTKEGIGVGATIDAFSEAYPDYEILYNNFSDLYYVKTNELVIQCILENDERIEKPMMPDEWVSVKKGSLKKETKIVEIRMI